MHQLYIICIFIYYFSIGHAHEFLEWFACLINDYLRALGIVKLNDRCSTRSYCRVAYNYLGKLLCSVFAQYLQLPWIIYLLHRPYENTL